MKSLAASLLLTTLFAAAPAWAASSVPPDNSAPAGLTSSLDNVPTLAPVSLPVPYGLAWERRVLAFQTVFETKLQAQSVGTNIDPIETGSINAAR